ncbi:hypothetical protein [Micromonospora sp. NPDC005367]|uniref:hypothetical protein n=1 Tax=Micromonospora sp. NPDC005367 TaxID=3155590 RepID=UPI0033BF5E01
MESRGKKRPRPRRSFRPEFKAEIVELCQRGDRALGQVSQDFDRRCCVVGSRDMLSPLRVRGQIAWARSVNAAAILFAGGTSTVSS